MAPGSSATACYGVPSPPVAAARKDVACTGASGGRGRRSHIQMTDVPASQRFCSQCGEPLRSDARFCAACGTAVAPEAVPPAPEVESSVPESGPNALKAGPATSAPADMAMAAAPASSARRRWSGAAVAVVAALVLVIAGAAAGAWLLFGGDGDEGEGAHALADRLVLLYEEPGTLFDGRTAALPAGLRDALNAGMAPGTPEEDLVRLPVHPDGTLLGSYRIERPNGEITFVLFYDVLGDDRDVEREITRQLDETPWQVIAGASTRVASDVNFRSTGSGDIEGIATVRPIPVADGAEPLVSVVYTIAIQPQRAVAEPDFELPPARRVPEHFPASFLMLEDMTTFSVLWTVGPAGRDYRLILLTTQSALDVTDEYRSLLGERGWELTGDRAVGFATVLEFESDDGAMQGTVTADIFVDDGRYTAIFLELLTSNR